MSRSASTVSSDSSSSSTDRMPWPSLLVLAAATLVMVTTEMLPTAVLGPMSAGLGVALARTAQLVSLWAAVVVVAGFPLVWLARGRDRRAVLAAGMLGLAVSSGLTAAAPGYLAALGARLLGAVAVGLLWATVNAHVADLVSEQLLGRAIAVVLGGATLGMVLGTPLARLIADHVSWRAAFATFAVVAAVIAVLVRMVVATAGDGASVEAKSGPAAGRSARPMLVVTGLVALVLVGHYGAYTFITGLAAAPAARLPGGVSMLLLAFGVASTVGVAAAGRFGRQTSRALRVVVVLTAVSLLGLSFAGGGPVLGLGVVLAWGVVSGAVPPLAQTEIFRLAGPEHRSTAGALIPVLFNGGIAVGAALSASLVARVGVAAVPAPAAALVAIAGVGLAVAARARARADRPSAADGVRGPGRSSAEETPSACPA